jgi:uncharacterized Zn finger protein
MTAMLFHFDAAQLQRLAGDKVFARGLAYFDNDAVGEIDTRNGRYNATVMGSELYEVSLRWGHKGLDGACDCPAAEDGFCKHQVALGLAVLAMAGANASGALDADSKTTNADKAIKTAKKAGEKAATETIAKTPAAAHTNKKDAAKAQSAAKSKSQPAKTAPVESDEALLARWLSGLPQAQVVEMAIRFASMERDLWRSTIAQARAALSPPEGQRDTVKSLIGSPRFLDWRGTMRYAQRLEPLFAIFERQIAHEPIAAISLMLFALKKIVSLYEKVDDSNGALGDVGARIGQTILRTAETVKTPSPELAKEVFAVLEIDDWGTLYPLKQVKPALGAQGMARLQALAEKRLEGLPETKDRWGSTGHARRHAQRLLEAVLAAQDDIDALIAVKAKALESGYDYLNLADACLEHRRTRQGIEWLERGIKFDPKELRLQDRLAEVYLSEGFAQDAVTLKRRVFEAQPTAEHYIALRQVALAAGNDWPAMREEIDQWAVHRPNLAAEAKLGLRIEYRLAEGDSEGAWALANGATLHLHTWAMLADAIEQTQPLDAVRVMKRLIDAQLEQNGQSQYRSVVQRLERMRRIAKRDAEAAAEADAYLADVRASHARKTKLMQMLSAL